MGSDSSVVRNGDQNGDGQKVRNPRVGVLQQKEQTQWTSLKRVWAVKANGFQTKECLSISSIYPGNSPKNQHNIAHFPHSLVEPMVSVEDRLPHAAASSFALVIHLISRLLPMPLAVDDAQWPKACFWAGDQARRLRKFRSGGACSTDFKHFSIRCGSEHGEQDMFFFGHFM